MTRKRARHLFLEMARRIYLEQSGTLKGFGKVAKHYSDAWRPVSNNRALDEKFQIRSYKDTWENELIKELRKSVNM